MLDRTRIDFTIKEDNEKMYVEEVITLTNEGNDTA